MKGQDLPTNGPTPLMEAAIALHEMFRAYVAAGFTEKQAIQLVAAQLAAGSTDTEPPE